MPQHDESTLPRWAQHRLEEARREVEEARREVEQLRAAHAVLLNRRWFTIQGPPERGATDWPDVYHLWFLDRDHPFPACQLGRGDVLLVGRRTENDASS